MTRNASSTTRMLGGIIAVAVAVAAPIAVHAQTSEDRNEIQLELNSRYSSNIARSNPLTAGQRGLSRSDTQISPTLTIDLARAFGDNSAFVNGTLGYDIHARNSELDRERIALAAGGRIAAGPCRLSPDVQLSRRQSDLADLVVLNNAVPADVKNVETRQSYGAELACGRVIGFSPYVGIRHERARNSDALRDLAEFNQTSYTGGIQYSSPAVGEVRAFVTRDETKLIGQPLAVGTNGYRVTEYGASIERGIGTRLTANASISHSELTSRNPLIKKFSGLNWNLGLTVLVTERLQLQGSLGRSLVNSLSSNAAYVVDRPVSARVSYAINERLRFDAGGQFSKRRYVFAGVPGSDFVERETRRTLDAGVSFRFSDRVSFRISGGHERRNANGTLFDYSNSFVGGGITLSL